MRVPKEPTQGYNKGHCKGTKPGMLGVGFGRLLWAFGRVVVVGGACKQFNRLPFPGNLIAQVWDSRLGKSVERRSRGVQFDEALG